MTSNIHSSTIQESNSTNQFAAQYTNLFSYILYHQARNYVQRTIKQGVWYFSVDNSRKEHLEKEIKDFEKKIVDNKNSIKENLENQSTKKNEIETQKKQVELVEKQLKSLR